MASSSELSEDIKKHYPVTRQLPDGRWIGLHRLLYHWTVHIDITPWGYEDRYCFMSKDDAVKAIENWDGEGDLPGNWHRHPISGRRRDETGKEWIEA